MTNNMALSGLRENVILTKSILTTNGFIGLQTVTNGAKRICYPIWCMTILTSAVGVTQAVQSLPTVLQNEV